MSLAVAPPWDQLAREEKRFGRLRWSCFLPPRSSKGRVFAPCSPLFLTTSFRSPERNIAWGSTRSSDLIPGLGDTSTAALFLVDPCSRPSRGSPSGGPGPDGVQHPYQLHPRSASGHWRPVFRLVQIKPAELSPLEAPLGRNSRIHVSRLGFPHLLLAIVLAVAWSWLFAVGYMAYRMASLLFGWT